MTALLAEVQSTPLREQLHIGAEICGEDLSRFEAALRSETFHARNKDGEDLRQALMNLVDDARKSGGYLFIQ